MLLKLFQWVRHSDNHSQSSEKPKWIQSGFYHRENYKIIRGKHKDNSFDLRSVHGFSDLTPKSQATRGKKTNWTSLKIRTFVHWRTFSRQRKDKLQNWRKYLQVTYQMGFPSRISKELSHFSNKTDDPVLKMGNGLE